MDKTLHIVKIGGKLINDPASLSKFLEAFVLLPESKILVHGGGSKATELSALLGIETRMIDGRRITNKDTLDVAVMVYAGLINKNIVAKLQGFNLNCMGICGADGDMIRAVKRPVGEIDYGYVGDITHIQTERIDSLINANIVPIISAISHDGSGQLLNTNADTIAAQLAIALSKIYHIRLSYCFEYPGVLYDLGTPELTMSSISEADFNEMKEVGSVNSGMIPKLSNGFDALKGQVKDVSICGIENLSTRERATLLTL